jgi:translation initiation factor 2B subunit (eIF-2B alpha/beta/delta family)
MANLRNLARWLTGCDLDAIEGLLINRSKRLTEMDERLADAAWPVMKGCRRILTLSRSSAVAAVLLGARKRGWRGEVVIFDGSPAGCGVEQARRLAESMAMVRSQPDAAMPSWFGGRGELVVIGADAVSPARLVNACGTRVLLELAAARSVRVLLAADSGKDLPDDELDEMLETGPVAKESGPDRSWSIFEVVPMTLVSDRVAE